MVHGQWPARGAVLLVLPFGAKLMLVNFRKIDKS
jgi:hypothetical protein